MDFPAHRNLTETHWSRVCTECLPECQMIAVFHSTDLLTFEICEAIDWFVCAHDTETLVCHTEKMIAAVGVNITDQAVEFRVIDLLTTVVKRIKNTWKIKDCQVTHERNLRCSILYDKWDISI